MWSLIQLKNGHIVSGHSSGEIKIWDERTKQCIGEWKGHTASVNRLIQIKCLTEILKNACKIFSIPLNVVKMEKNL